MHSVFLSAEHESQDSQSADPGSPIASISCDLQDEIRNGTSRRKKIKNKNKKGKTMKKDQYNPGGF